MKPQSTLSSKSCKLASVFFLLCLSISQLWAVGEWQIYQSFSTYSGMSLFHDKIYTVSGTNVFSYDIHSAETANLSRLTGLTGSEVQFLAHSEEADVLAIIYADGNLDLMDANGHISNLPDYANKTMTGDKSIYYCHVVGKDLYLATGFGFLIVDLEKYEFSASYNFGHECKAAFRSGNHLYFSDASGLWQCPTSANTYDWSLWTKISNSSIIDVAEVPSMSDSTQTECWVLMSNQLMYKVGGDASLTQIHNYWNWEFARMRYSGSCVFLRCGNVPMFMDLSTQNVYSFGSDMAVYDMISLNDTTAWLLNSQEGILPIHFQTSLADSKGLFTYDDEFIVADGGTYPSIYPITFYKGTLYGVKGVPEDQKPGTSGMFVTLTDGEWTSLTSSNLKYGDIGALEFRALTTAVPDPLNEGRVYIGSYRDGLYYIDIENDSLLAYYNQDNSPIQSILPDYKSEDVTGIYPDEDGYVWIANGNVSPVIKCLTPSGQWIEYPMNGFDPTNWVTKVFRDKHDSYQFMWFMGTAAYNACKCAIYYDARTPEDLTDDEYVYFASFVDQDGNAISPNYFRDIAEDNNGAIWILTNAGPFVIDSPYDAFKSPGRVRRVKVPRNDGTNLADYLLANVDTKCIAVDASNRKWIGTASDGLYLLSPDGLETIHHFTSSNSPLVSDEILGLAIDDVTGLVYISVAGGIYTYASDAIAGKADLNNVYCYPNPVRPDYTGNLHVSGLMDNTEVRITDINNNVIFATTSSGSMVEWNLCNASGQRVKTGIYLVYGVSEDGKKGCVSKFMVVK